MPSNLRATFDELAPHLPPGFTYEAWLSELEQAHYAVVIATREGILRNVAPHRQRFLAALLVYLRHAKKRP